MPGLLQDLRYAIRQLRNSPGFTAVAIITLALGIGATTAIFSVVDAVVLKPLPFPTADRLVRIRSVIAASGQGGVASYPDFLDWRARNHVFSAMAAFRTNDFTLTSSREPRHLQGAVVSAQLFSLLGQTPFLGRSFLQEEDNPATTGGTDPVILSYGLWQREFGGDPSALGRTIQLGNQSFTLIGVMPKDFQFPIQADPMELWTTIAFDARGGQTAVTQRGAHYLDVIGLLNPGVELQQAQAEMATIASSLNKQYPEIKPRSVRIVPEIETLAGPARIPLFVLLGAVTCVLLIACVNLASLLLARGTGRSKEMAIRAALGATRRRAVRQLLTESIALGLLGGGLGLLLAHASFKSLIQLIPSQLPRLNTIGLDARVLGFAFLISLLAGILFGLAPALRASKVSLRESLKEGGSTSNTSGRGHSRLRSALVVSEITLAVVLLFGTGLLVQSFLHLVRVDPGFNPQHVLTFQLDSPAGKQDSQITTFFREVVERINALPGVSSTSAAASLPLTEDNIRSSVEIEGQPTPMGSRPAADFNSVTPNYFRTMGIPTLAGRDFTERDDSTFAPVVIVNSTFARMFFPGRNPIGQHIRPGIGNGYGPGEPPMREIVGVVGDVKQGDIRADAAPEVYAPLAQSPSSPVSIVIRTETDPQSIVRSARFQVASLSKNAPIYHVETLDQYLAESAAAPRFVTQLIGGFTGLAMLLVCLGIYGVVSYIVVQRTHEIGVRMALGAQKSKILRSLLGEGLKLALLGLAIGIVLALRLMRALSNLLYGVKSADPLTTIAVSIILISVVLLASYIPARRAMKTDPMEALRYE